MSFSRSLRLAAAAAILGMFLSLPAAGAHEGHREDIVEGPLVGDRAPDMRLKTLDKEEFQLSRWIGKKPFVMVFFATWCRGCKEEIPVIKSIYRRYAGDKLGLVAVNTNFNDSLERSLRYREDNELPYTIVFDKQGDAAKNYMVLGVPMILMVDRSGIIRYRSSRFPDNLDKAIEFISR